MPPQPSAAGPEPHGSGPPLALVRIVVDNLAAAREALDAGGVANRETGGALVVAAEAAMGAVYVFERANLV